jgi:methanogenic corrinoid protein MtbC1
MTTMDCRAPGAAPSCDIHRPSGEHGELARQYLELLLQGRRTEASDLILGEVRSGMPVKDVYLHVFQPAQYEVGRLWQCNRISVAQEHYCTALTQLIMSQLYSRIFSHEKGNFRLVAACVGGELHEIGIRMVADFFEMDGWDTYYLGTGASTEQVLKAIQERQADLFCVSATMTFHLDLVVPLVRAARASNPSEKLKIMVGGAPFIKAPELWRQIGADGTAADAQEAVAVGNQLVHSLKS